MAQPNGVRAFLVNEDGSRLPIINAPDRTPYTVAIPGQARCNVPVQVDGDAHVL